MQSGVASGTMGNHGGYTLEHLQAGRFAGFRVKQFDQERYVQSEIGKNSIQNPIQELPERILLLGAPTQQPLVVSRKQGRPQTL